MGREEQDDERITDRLPLPGEEPSDEDGRVTDRLPDDFFKQSEGLTTPGRRLTDRLEDGFPSFEPAGGDPRPGDVIGGRFMVESAALGDETGEARVFRCRDRKTGATVALKLYKANLSPKEKVVERLLNLDHPNLVGLRDFGRHNTRFYEVLEFCEGGALADIAPLSEAALEGYLGQIVEGLEFCHRQGIVHRDVKPNNLLFRDTDKSQLVIGDFGISSLLPEGRQVKKTKTYMFFTIDYCAPEQLRLRQVGPPADYYSLGIALIHLLKGNTPFAGMEEDEIVDRHLQGTVPLPEGISERFEKLLKGLLRQNPKTRWGYDQVRQWLDGKPVLGVDGRPDRDEVFFGQEIHYPECPQATNPVLLARNLDRFDAAPELFRGRIGLWVKLFDPELSIQVREIEENYTDRPQLGLLKLRHTLDPTLPLTLAGRDIRDITDLAGALRSKDKELLAALRDGFWDGTMETWIEAVFRNEHGRDLAEKIGRFRKRYKGRHQAGTLHLLFMLDPQAPLNLGQGLAARTPEGVAEALLKRPQVKDAVKAYMFGGQLSAWIEIAFPDRREDAEAIGRLADEYRDDRELGLNALIWYLKPKTPFLFGEDRVSDPKELAALIDNSPNGWERGEKLVGNSLFRAWLLATGILKDPVALDELVRSERIGVRVKVDMILRLLDPDLARPEIAVDRADLDLGNIEAGGDKTAEIEFHNKGRGVLTGALRVDGPGGEVECNPARLEGPSTLVRVTIRPPAWLSEGVVRKAVMVAESNGGVLQVPIIYRIVKPPPEPEAPEPKGLLGKLAKWLG